MEASSDPRHRETATLAGGCFWCLEAVYERLRGVDRVESGYTGGRVETPSYEQVTAGTTGHAEAVRLTYDPATISYRELLEIFFAIHDPTTKDRQGADVGSQYRSAIFYHSPEQRETAERVIRELADEGVWSAPVVTEIAPAEAFWPAEAYHREYYRRHPDQAYCRVVIDPKLARLRETFAEKLEK